MFNFFKPKSNSNNLSQIKLKTGGMHCSSCAVNIDLTLEEMAGVHQCQTNFAQSVTTVDYDPAVIKTTTIKKAIENLGYKIVAS